MESFITDIPRFNTALAEWLACLVIIFLLRPRISRKKLVPFAAVMLAIQSVFLIATDSLEGWLWFVCMLTAALLMYAFITIGADISGGGSIFFEALAFIIAEFAASFEWQIVCIVRQSGFSSKIGELVMLFVVYGLIYGTVYFCLKQIEYSRSAISFTVGESVGALIGCVLIFLVSNIGFASVYMPYMVQDAMLVCSIRTLIDLGGMVLLQSQLVQRHVMQAKYDVQRLESLMQHQYLQYEQSQETIELINYKYHDLKHHIIALRAEDDKEKRDAYLERMENEIRHYEAQNKTGNKVLDTLLTSKNLNCQVHGIEMTSVVDGALLDFMDVLDICSIFGNALDNAIEYEKNIPKEKRMIHLSVFSRKRLLIIRVENYFEGDETKMDRSFATTKKNRKFHGYGIRSIRAIVHKYHGEMTIDVKNQWFVLNILIPLEEKKE